MDWNRLIFQKIDKLIKVMADSGIILNAIAITLIMLALLSFCKNTFEGLTSVGVAANHPCNVDSDLFNTITAQAESWISHFEAGGHDRESVQIVVARERVDVMLERKR